jgi:hypothetical protein
MPMKRQVRILSWESWVWLVDEFATSMLEVP